MSDPNYLLLGLLLLGTGLGCLLGLWSERRLRRGLREGLARRREEPR